MPANTNKSDDTLMEKVNYAIEGIIYTVKTQKNIRYHFLAAAFVLLASAFLPITKVECLLVVVIIALVLIVEVLNTAIEELVNMISPHINQRAKMVKDIAAGAVLISAIGAVILGSLIFIPYLFSPASRTLSFFHGLSKSESSAYIVLFSLLLVIVLIVVAKATYGKGEPLHGGMPSGHSAVAFSIGTAVVFLSSNPIIIVLTFCLVIMVSHSRLLLKIHTYTEVVVGALVGAIVTACIFMLFHYFL